LVKNLYKKQHWNINSIGKCLSTTLKAVNPIREHKTILGKPCTLLFSLYNGLVSKLLNIKAMDGITEFLKILRDLPRVFRSTKVEYVKKELDLENIWSFYFKVPADFKIEAGEHLMFRLNHSEQDDRGNFRFYSPSSAPREELLRISTRYFGDTSSSFKRALFNMAPGNQINVMGPIGTFTLEDISKKYVFIAGGIGITPFRSIITDLLLAGILPEITLYYKNRTENFLFKLELDALVKANTQLKIKYLIDPIDIKEAELTSLNQQEAIFYIAGAPSFVNSYKQKLKGLNIPQSRIKNDSFRKLKD